MAAATSSQPVTANVWLAAHAASAKYHIPMNIIWGVLGLETDFGRNITTSSAGAMGVAQFIESTAKTYNYPYENSNDPGVIAQQVDIAGKYLSQLYHQKGNWDAALHAYSGGGYGLSQVAAKSATLSQTQALEGHSGNLQGGVLDTVPGGDAVKAAGKAVGDVVSTAASIPGKFYALITNPKFWIRIGESIAGVILLFMGLKELAGR